MKGAVGISDPARLNDLIYLYGSFNHAVGS
jgi:hypothetical protein